ncbi:MAG TPA: hypothetical protein ENK57_12700 [Polyangiaceae bacterium]|nr:hypothetical protein [Polyangiaceae bacterium]
MSRFDVLKSLVRSAARASGERLSKVSAVAGVRQAIDEVRARRSTLTEAAIARAITHGVPTLAAASVSLRGGRVVLDLDYKSRGDTPGETLAVSLIPEQARFAPRGAKEVIFSVEPPEAVNDARVRELVGALAAAIARALWGPVLGERTVDEQAMVDREGARLRADLRSVPAVRAALEGSPLAMALEIISIESFAIEDRVLRIVLALPFPGAP